MKLKPESRDNIGWEQARELGPRTYCCGYCGERVSSSLGYYPKASKSERIRVCAHCQRPTYFEQDSQTPGNLFGNSVAHLPDDVASVYEEARCAYSAEAFTGAVILCRKLLMNIAVQKGADSDNTFKGYVDHLETKHYTPPDSGVWIDKIRSLGNEANHELRVMSREDAELAIEFSEMLLRFIFEYPGRAGASDTEGG